MATYNRAHLIMETLISIQNQSFSNWECLIVDDGSTDNTREALGPILKNDLRYKYSQRDSAYSKGLPGCRNKGIDNAQGEYIIFFDDDDIVHPENLLLCVKELEKGNYYSYCRFLRSTFTGKFHYKFDLNKDFRKTELTIKDLESVIKGDIPFNSCQILWKRNCFDKNKFDEALMYAEEWECYSRILSTGIKGINIEKVLFFGRKHEHSNTGEFWNNDPVRRNSKVSAAKLVFENLKNRGLLTDTLVNYFVRLGIFLNADFLVKLIINNSGLSFGRKIRYWLLYESYPVLAFAHRTKKKIKKMIN